MTESTNVVYVMCSGLSCTHVSWIILRWPACFIIRVACGDPEMGEVCTQANIARELAVSTMCPLQGRVVGEQLRAVSFIPFCRIWADLAILIGPKKGKLRALIGLDICRICADLAILIGSDEAFCRIFLTGTPANTLRLFVLFDHGFYKLVRLCVICFKKQQ